MVNEDECIKAGINPKEVLRIQKKLEALCKEANKLKIGIFMGSSPALYAYDDQIKALKLASLSIKMCDGGCGASSIDDDGLLRME